MEDNLPQNYKISEDNYLGNENLYKLKVSGSKFPHVTYIPEQVTSDTAIHLHFKGSGKTGDIYNTAKNIAEYGGDSIVIMPNINYSEEEILVNESVSMIKAMQQEHGIESVKVSFDGWSGGTYGALATFVECYKQDVEIEGTPMIHFLDDASSLTQNPKNSNISRTYILENGGAEAIAKYNPIMITYYDETSPTVTKKEACMVDYAEAGAISIRAVMTNSNGHWGVKNNMHLNGVQDVNGTTSELPLVTTDDWLESTGKKNEIRYDLLIGTDEDGKPIWQTIPEEYATTKEGILAYAYLYGIESVETGNSMHLILDSIYTIPVNSYATDQYGMGNYNLLSDSELLASCVNDITSVISSSNCINASCSTSFSSTTSVPTGIPGVITEYLSVANQSLARLMGDLNSITTIGYSINLLDKNIGSEAEKLNEEDIAPETGKGDEPETDNSVEEPKKRGGGGGGEETTEMPKDPGIPGLEPGYKTGEENANLEEVVIEQDGYKAVLGVKDGNVETMKYQYEYNSLEEAGLGYQDLINEYKNSEFIDSIVQEGTSVELSFKSEALVGANIEELVNKY